MSELIIAEKADLVGIANQIRTQIGSSKEMSLDEMKTGLADANSAVTSAISSLRGKGVAVPFGANVTNLPQMIEEIEIIDTSGSATEADILIGKTATVNDEKLTGTMPNNGAMDKTMDGVNTKSVSVPAGYTSGGTVSMDNTVDNAVAAALAALTEKGVTVPAGANVTGLADLIAAVESGGEGNISAGTFTPSEDMTKFTPENYYAIFNGNAHVIFAIGIYSLNDLTLTGTAVTGAASVYGGWATRLVCTSSGSPSGNRPQFLDNTIVFSTNYVLQAGITYKYVLIGLG